MAMRPHEDLFSFFCSRGSREAVRIVFLVRGAPARLSEWFFSFAGLPRGCQNSFSRSRDSREAVRMVFLARGAPARLPAITGDRFLKKID